MKLEAYDKFLKKNPNLRNNVILLQIIKCDKCELSNSLFKQLDETIIEMKKNYGDDIIYVLKVEQFSVQERFALLSLGDVLYYLQVREGNCMVLYKIKFSM